MKLTELEKFLLMEVMVASMLVMVVAVDLEGALQSILTKKRTNFKVFFHYMLESPI